MQTAISDAIRNTPQGREADSILRSCVHCGFCTATCPTYQLQGDELDGPRGRIYLIKQMLEGNAVTEQTQVHLDRCLHCLSCETACPSGVKYGRLLDIGREMVEERVPRGLSADTLRHALRVVLPYPRRFGMLLRIAQRLRSLLPSAWRMKVPLPQTVGMWPAARHSRKMLVLEGCVQAAATPATNAVAARILDRLGISLLRAGNAGCCGAVSHHLNAHGEALQFARRNIDAWWPYVEQGIEAIIMTASGCGAMVKDYKKLLSDDPSYAEKAARITELTKDLSEVLARENVESLGVAAHGVRVAFQAPCSLQHAQGINGVVESLLARCGYHTMPVVDAHLCCGSAGTYSILQPERSQQLLTAKLTALQAQEPELIATANIGCQLHMQSRAALPVKHWIELLDKTA